MIKRMMQVKDRDSIPAFLKDVGLNGRICEVGVWLGKYHWKLIECEPAEIVGVDLFIDFKGSNGEERMKALIDELAQVPEVRSRLIKGDSREAWKTFSPGYFDFVYIDADHRYKYVKLDVEAWWTRVRPGGVLAGHDYAPAPPKRKWGRGVIQAVDELVAREGLENQFHVTSEKVDPSWMVIKP